MKVWIKITLAAIAGFGGGFGAGFWFHKKLNNVEFEEVSEEEMNEITSKLEEGSAKPKNDILTDEDLSTDPDELRKQLQGKKSYIEADREAKEKYAQIWGTVNKYSNEDNANNLPIEADETDEIENGIDESFIQEALEEQDAKVGNDSDANVYAIELVDFYTENGYDKITIDWYEPDSTFINENEEVIADITSYIGDIDIHELFKTSYENEDPDVRFVRNESYSTDYEIIRHHKSWAEMTGIGGSE